MPRIWCSAGLLVALVMPLQAQYTGSIGFHVSRNDAMPTAPHLGGLTLSSYAGPLGVRLNGGLHFTQRDMSGHRSNTRIGVGAWTADADLVLSPFHTFSPLAPYGFLGIGGQGVRFRNLPDTALATWSYGGGLALRFGGPVSLDADARYRQALDGDELLSGSITRDWEYRIGLTIGFGQRRSRDYHRPRARSHSPVRKEPIRESRSRVRPTAAIVTGAERYIGTRYRYGGAAPGEGFDCSGFVQYVYGRQGVRLARTARSMANEGDRIETRRDALRAGDLMLFADDGRRIDHVAIYAGEGRILHATASGGGVRYDDLDSPRGRWFLERWVDARRVVGDDGSLTRDATTREQVDESELDPPDRAPLPGQGR